VTLIGRLAGAALDLALPAACAGCGREGAPLCERCVPALDARLDLPGGTAIGLPAELPDTLLQLEWCAAFTGPVRDALHQLKYSSERRLAVPLGRAVARRWARVGVGATVVVPVPVHAHRERQRGYDQAALIAAVAAGELHLPFARALERGRVTVAQFELGRDQRAANVAGAFRPRDGDPAAVPAVAERWVLLVDDVVTTGATLGACGEALERMGAFGVSAIAVARER
jgi:predicted amidophosphoribosyltransferase